MMAQSVTVLSHRHLLLLSGKGDVGPVSRGKGTMSVGKAPAHIISTCALPSVVSLHQHEGMGIECIVNKSYGKHDARGKVGHTVFFTARVGLSKMGTNLVAPDRHGAEDTPRVALRLC